MKSSLFSMRKARNLKYETFPQKLPEADIVVFSWTNYGAAGLNHVLFHNYSSFIPNTYSWKSEWKRYAFGLEEYSRDHELSSTLLESRSWCYFRLAKISGKRVLLIKSNMHLSMEGEITISFLKDVINAVRPSYCISHESVGGTRVSEHVGDVLATDLAYLAMSGGKEYEEYNQETFSGNWDQPLDYLYNFSKNFIRPDLSKESIEDYSYWIGKRYGEVFVPQLTPTSPHPKFFALMDSPIYTTNKFVVASNDHNFELYAGMGEDSAAVMIAVQDYRVPAVSICCITDPWVSNKLSQSEQGGFNSMVYVQTALTCSVNSARAIYKVLTEL